MNDFDSFSLHRDISINTVLLSWYLKALNIVLCYYKVLRKRNMPILSKTIPRRKNGKMSINVYVSLKQAN